MHEVLVNRLGGLSLPRKSVVRLTDRPNMTLDVYRGRNTTIQQHHSLVAKLARTIMEAYKKTENGIYSRTLMVRTLLIGTMKICSKQG